MIFTLLFLQFVARIFATDEHWKAYKAEHGKEYRGVKEEARRRCIWEMNRERVVSHNDLADRGTKFGLVGTTFRKDDPILSLEVSEEEIPEELDWRKEGFLTPALDQKNCGSCYAFSIASAVQAQLFKTNGTIRELSEQQLVDCSVLFGNHGCQGGSLRNTLRYIKRYGILPSQQYPYRGKQSLCRELLIPKQKAVSIKAWAILPSGDEEALLHAVARVGPLAVSVNASPYTFQLYHSGVYDDPNCTGDTLNHAMLLVGYTREAWILKNWWTGRWGQGGYMYVKRGHNRCGVASYAAYLTVPQETN